MHIWLDKSGVLIKGEKSGSTHDNFKPMPALIDRLVDSGHDVSIVSDASLTMVEKKIMEKLGYKLGVFVHTEFAANKKEVETFTTIADKFGHDKAEVCFVDDTEQNVLNGAAAGVDAVKFENPAQLEAYFVAKGLLPQP